MDDVTTSFDEFMLLDGSVPDLAATLTTQAEQDAEDANISFLRGEVVDEREETSPEPDEDFRQRPRRTIETTMNRQRHTTVAHRSFDGIDHHQATASSSMQDYGGLPSANFDEDDLSSLEPVPSLPLLSDGATMEEQEDLRERMISRLRRREYTSSQLGQGLSSRSLSDTQHTYTTAPHLAGGSTSRAASDTRAISREEPAASAESVPNLQSLASESSLRTTALLQAVRRNSQFSAHSRSQLQRYVRERERSGNEPEDEREASTGSASSSLSPSQRLQIELREARVRQEIRLQQELLSEHQRRLERLAEEEWHLRNRVALPEPSGTESRRRRYWQVPPSQTQSSSRSVDNAIRYVGRLRQCETDLEGYQMAEEIGFDRQERIREDFLTDTTQIPPPQDSSWLRIGGVLAGIQSAIDASPSTSHHHQQRGSQGLSTSHRSRVRHPTFGTNTARTTSPVRASASSSSNSANRPSYENQSPSSSMGPSTTSNNNERWPVKVTFQRVDHNTMTLSGTMEAFNVPDKSSVTRESSITTYLEGEIIDFNNHSLETKSFKADAGIDAMYWARLPPFRDLKNKEALIRALTSERWLREELMEKWILMRWKEKFFVTPSDAEYSLTISGFYYISLCRANGSVEGLYYDPMSTPYQHLVLKPESRTFPTYEFQ